MEPWIHSRFLYITLLVKVEGVVESPVVVENEVGDSVETNVDNMKTQSDKLSVKPMRNENFTESTRLQAQS